jgi:hypothetical protein
LRVQHRERIHALARWSLAEGRPVPMDHVALIIGALTHLGEQVDRRVGAGLLLSIMTGWCQEHAVPLPASMAESLDTYLAYCADGRGVSAMPRRPATRRKRA